MLQKAYIDFNLIKSNILSIIFCDMGQPLILEW